MEENRTQKTLGYYKKNAESFTAGTQKIDFSKTQEKFLKYLPEKARILDFGCGSGEMLELFYRNKYRPKRYLGLEIREKQVEENKDKFAKLDFAEFRQQDLCQPELDLGETFDIITCFEVMEHIGHKNADVFLDNIAYHCSPETIVYLSTPNYDPRVGAAF